MILDILLGMIRQALMGVGGGLVAKGLATNEQINTIVGGLLALVAVAWGAWHKHRVATLTAQAAAQTGATDPLAKAFTSNVQKLVPALVLALCLPVMAIADTNQPTISVDTQNGLLTMLSTFESNMVVQAGVGTSLRAFSLHPTLDQAYPILKVRVKSVTVLLNAVHSTSFQADVNREMVGVGTTICHRKTPKLITDIVPGAVRPIAPSAFIDWSVFFNVVTEVDGLVKGELGRRRAEAQAGLSTHF